MRVSKPIGFDRWPRAEKEKWWAEIRAEEEKFNRSVKSSFRPLPKVKPEKQRGEGMRNVIENPARELMSIKTIFGKKV